MWLYKLLGFKKDEKMKTRELKEILDLHKKWLNSEEGGVRADLSSADLSSANLSSANMRSADISYANLSYANLSYANLSSVNLSYADLSSTNLSYADLRYANLRYADLSSADLSHADLRYAVGEMKYVKSLQCEKYYISYTSKMLNIGCQSHTIEEWKMFGDDTISRMDSQALEWWQKWKPILMNIIEISPALENEGETK